MNLRERSKRYGECVSRSEEWDFHTHLFDPCIMGSFRHTILSMEHVMMVERKHTRNTHTHSTGYQLDAANATDIRIYCSQYSLASFSSRFTLRLSLGHSTHSIDFGANNIIQYKMYERHTAHTFWLFWSSFFQSISYYRIDSQ